MGASAGQDVVGCLGQGGQFERFLRSRAPSSDTPGRGIGYDAGTMVTDPQKRKVRHQGEEEEEEEGEEEEE